MAPAPELEAVKKLKYTVAHMASVEGRQKGEQPAALARATVTGLQVLHFIPHAALVRHTQGTMCKSLFKAIAMCPCRTSGSSLPISAGRLLQSSLCNACSCPKLRWLLYTVCAVQHLVLCLEPGPSHCRHCSAAPAVHLMLCLQAAASGRALMMCLWQHPSSAARLGCRRWCSRCAPMATWTLTT